MFSIVEQRYLLEMLKSEQTRNRFTKFDKWDKTTRTRQFYRVMGLLKENDLITSTPINNSNRKRYKLTVFGRAIASIIAKHTKTEGYKKYAFSVEMYLV